MVRSPPQPQVTALYLELTTLVQTSGARFLVSQLSQLRASLSLTSMLCQHVTLMTLYSRRTARVCSKQDPSDSEIAVGRKWINRTSLARCHTLPMKSCCKVNKAQPAQSAHCDKLKEDFQALPDKNALCKKPRGQSDTEIIKLIIFRAITNSRTRVLIEQPGQHTSFKYSGLFPHKHQRSGNHK